eukprot:TRINITY_DN4097_c0_g1_i1.p1 TRINITY_DN4097_c0_g1~~TRINITY_DN4097_c0_g1_i1.p1  ORF type:complete len:118 (+),score=15.80 TRINITY_DN4097_c0_g1_i1:43-396(+)
MSVFIYLLVFFNGTANTDIYTILFVGSVRCVQETVSTQSTWAEEVAEAISKIKAFLETTISVEIGWILVTVIVVVGCAVALKKIKTSKQVCLYLGEIKQEVLTHFLLFFLIKFHMLN